jgi:hypothetical protein
VFNEKIGALNISQSGIFGSLSKPATLFFTLFGGLLWIQKAVYLCGSSIFNRKQKQAILMVLLK